MIVFFYSLCHKFHLFFADFFRRLILSRLRRDFNLCKSVKSVAKKLMINYADNQLTFKVNLII